ncbi:MAG: hypothetical protein U5L06_04745 [Rhodovibrio sp.]|nr:hypothetical protein [Rhodovibrio sp.]
MSRWPRAEASISGVLSCAVLLSTLAPRASSSSTIAWSSRPAARTSAVTP